MKKYKATITYELDNGAGECFKEYIVQGTDSDNAELHGIAAWNTDIMEKTNNRTCRVRCEVIEI